MPKNKYDIITAMATNFFLKELWAGNIGIVDSDESWQFKSIAE